MCSRLTILQNEVRLTGKPQAEGTRIAGCALRMSDETSRRVAILTGATGFLGASLMTCAAPLFDDIYAVASGRSASAADAVPIDLANPDAAVRLADSFHFERRESAVVIHAAAVVDNSEDGRCQNASMARQVATWVRDSGARSSVLVSTVSVYPDLPRVRLDSPLQPSTVYGLGKLEAER